MADLDATSSQGTKSLASNRLAYRRRLALLQQQRLQQLQLQQQQQQQKTAGSKGNGAFSKLSATYASAPEYQDYDYSDFLYQNVDEDDTSAGVGTSGAVGGLSSGLGVSALALRRQRLLAQRRRLLLQQQQQLLMQRRNGNAEDALLTGAIDRHSGFGSSGYGAGPVYVSGGHKSSCGEGLNPVLALATLAGAALAAYFIFTRVTQGNKRSFANNFFDNLANLSDFVQIGMSFCNLT